MEVTFSLTEKILSFPFMDHFLSWKFRPIHIQHLKPWTDGPLWVRVPFRTFLGLSKKEPFICVHFPKMSWRIWMAHFTTAQKKVKIDFLGNAFVVFLIRCSFNSFLLRLLSSSTGFIVYSKSENEFKLLYALHALFWAQIAPLAKKARPGSQSNIAPILYHHNIEISILDSS